MGFDLWWLLCGCYFLEVSGSIWHNKAPKRRRLTMAKLTKRVVDSTIPESGRPVLVWDDILHGFGLKVLPSGRKRYIVKYRAGGGGRRAPQRWVTVGTHGKITCEEARSEARQILAAADRGEDPQSEKLALRVAPTMTELWERYESDQLPLKKPSTASEYVRYWNDVIRPKLGRLYVTEVSRANVDRLHKSLGNTPYQANRVLAQLSRLFNLAEAWGWRDPGTNPCRHVEKFKEHARERYLSSDELVSLGKALETLGNKGELRKEAAAAIRLLLLTGARLNEILTARREWVDLQRRVIELPDSKTGKKPVFLSDPAVEVINHLDVHRSDPKNPYLLPGRRKGKPLNNLSKPWRRVCEEAGLPGVRLHDLRHTAASIAVGQGATLPVIGRLLGHSQPQTTHRYAHVYIDPALAVANSIGAAIGTALGIQRPVENAKSDVDSKN
jgi:integrase